MHWRGGGGGGERSEPAHVSVCMNACVLNLEYMGYIFYVHVLVEPCSHVPMVT